jgi:hypothetical protein
MGGKHNRKTRAVKVAKRQKRIKRIKLGDVIEIPLSANRLAYAQFVYNNREPPGFGNLVRVLPGIFDRRPESFGEVVQQRERFVAYFPAQAAVRLGIVAIVAHEEIPGRFHSLPLFRACNQNFKTGEKTWYLCDGKPTKLGKLPQKYYDLPIEEIVSFDVLVERIGSGWSPRDEVY